MLKNKDFIKISTRIATRKSSYRPSGCSWRLFPLGGEAMITFIVGVIVGVFLTMLAVAAWVVFEDEGGPDDRSDNHRSGQRDRPDS